MSALRILQPGLLGKGDPVEEFDCRVEELNLYLRKFALNNQNANAARTYVARAEAGGKIAGFYTLAYSSVSVEDAPERLKKGLARHPIPVMLLARLAIDASYQGMGFGAGLLLDAFQRTLQAAEIGGLRALVVDAKDEKAAAFYERYDFIPFGESNPNRLYLLISDLRKTIV